MEKIAFIAILIAISSLVLAAVSGIVLLNMKMEILFGLICWATFIVFVAIAMSGPKIKN
jgi:hypothetical protein